MAYIQENAPRFPIQLTREGIVVKCDSSASAKRGGTRYGRKMNESHTMWHSCSLAAHGVDVYVVTHVYGQAQR